MVHDDGTTRAIISRHTGIYLYGGCPRLRREDAIILVECKNWMGKCGKNECVNPAQRRTDRQQDRSGVAASGGAAGRPGMGKNYVMTHDFCRSPLSSRTHGATRQHSLHCVGNRSAEHPLWTCGEDTSE
jgi:hypothetical protein